MSETNQPPSGRRRGRPSHASNLLRTGVAQPLRFPVGVNNLPGLTSLSASAVQAHSAPQASTSTAHISSTSNNMPRSNSMENPSSTSQPSQNPEQTARSKSASCRPRGIGGEFLGYDHHVSEDGSVMGDSKRAEQKWSEFNIIHFGKMKKRLHDAVPFCDKSRGTPKVLGRWPILASSLIDPRADPIGFWGNETDAPPTLTREHFAAVSLLLWAPELRWPHLYPAGRPCCPWHGTTDCVRHNGWPPRPRGAVDETGTTAVWSRSYLCTVRQKTPNQRPYSFLGHSADVIAQAPTYVQRWWREFGYHFTWRSGVRWRIVDRMRGVTAGGLGFSGFLKSLAEQHRSTHLSVSQMWRSYVDWRHASPAIAGPSVERVQFFAFDGLDYAGFIPSLSWLISVGINDIETRIPFCTRSLQMVDGEVLAGDHSHKYCKFIFIAGDKADKAFEGLYVLMNGFGKIVGFWFTHGTSTEEIENVLRGVARRFKMHGFKGPILVTTDRCCDERSFWSGTANKSAAPIFESLARSHGIQVDPSSSAKGPRRLALPQPPVLVPAHQVSNICGQILETVREFSGKKVISVDCEWDLGSSFPQLIQIGLRDGSTFLFRIASVSGQARPTLNQALKNLLETDSIFKTGNRICQDVAKLANIEVTLKPTIGDYAMGAAWILRSCSNRFSLILQRHRDHRCQRGHCQPSTGGHAAVRHLWRH